MTGFSVSAFVQIFNIAMLALGFLALGLLDRVGSGGELPRVERIVHDIDPERFMIVSKISEDLSRA